MRKSAWSILAVILFSVMLYADQVVVFEENTDRFANPERGFYRYQVLNKIDSQRWLDDLRHEYVTLIYGKVEANAFRDKDLSDEFLHQIEEGFYRARRAGLKVIFCMSYSDQIGAPDASVDTILHHIHQLKELLIENADVIYLVKAGFIGPWGEWHSWQASPDTLLNRRLILDRLLETLPPNRMVVLRCPNYKLDIFDGKTLTPKQAFDGSPIARIGFHNDCFLSSENDVGTYNTQKPRWAWIDYIGAETRFTPFGGETCKLYSLSECSDALDEMRDLHCSWLNWDYHPDVRTRWQKNGCIDEIESRLGYRFVPRKLTLSDLTSSDFPKQLDIQIELDNTGFASPFNPRPVELILRSGSSTLVRKLKDDPRWWLPGKTIQISASLDIPIEYAGRTCRIELSLPDPQDRLRDDVRYAIRLAGRIGTRDIWDETTGTNVLFDSLYIPKPVPNRIEIQKQ